MTSTDPLRIALPKGRLLDDALAMFATAGCSVPDAAELRTRKLVSIRDGIEWIFVKDCDVPVYVEHGAADLGIAGLDQILEHESTAYRLVEMPFGGCRMSVIAAPETPPLTRGQRSTVATKYPRIAHDVIDQIGASAEVIPLGGSVELAAVLRLTTHIIDLVQSGATIAANGLVEQATLMTIAPWLIAGRDAYRTETKRIRDLVSRIEETINAAV